MIRIQEARYVSGHILWLRFSDGVEGEVDLASELDGEIFESLRDPKAFRSFTLHPELHTVVWPNGADFAPEFLHERVRVRA
jgi:Protein of unknown function (DUF2442)